MIYSWSSCIFHPHVLHSIFWGGVAVLVVLLSACANKGILHSCHRSPHFKGEHHYRTPSLLPSACKEAALGKKLIGKEAFAECRKSTRQRFTLGKMKMWKNPKIIAIFFRGRPPPASVRPSSANGHRSRYIFCAKFTANTAGGIRTHDLSLVCLLLYHCTTLWLMSGFRYLSSYIILNRE